MYKPIKTNLGLYSIFMRLFEPILKDLAVFNLACAYFGPFRASFRSFFWVFKPIWAHFGPFFIYLSLLSPNVNVNRVRWLGRNGLFWAEFVMF